MFFISAIKLNIFLIALPESSTGISYLIPQDDSASEVYFRIEVKRGKKNSWTLSISIGIDMFMIIFPDIKKKIRGKNSLSSLLQSPIILFFDSTVDFMINRFSINACALSQF